MSPSKEKNRAKVASWNDANTVKLIKFVERNKPLWSVDVKEYHTGKDSRYVLWAEIGEKLDCSGAEAKKQWFNLRKNFKKKLDNVASGAAAPKKSSRWPWWDVMQFVRDSVITSKTKSSLDGNDEEDNNPKADFEEKETEDVGDESDSGNARRSPGSPRYALYSDEEDMDREMRNAGSPPSVKSCR